MKKRFVLMLLYSLALSLNWTWANPIKLICVMEPAVNQERQWVYWVYLEGYKMAILDSCYLQQGQESVTFEHDFTTDNCSSYLVFTKRGPTQTWINIDPYQDKEVTVYIKEKGTFVDPEAEGSALAQEKHAYLKRNVESRIKIEQWEDEYAQTENASLLDSIKKYRYDMQIGSYWDRLKKTQSAQGFLGAFKGLRQKGVLNEQQVDSLENIMKEKYAYSQRVQNYFSPLSYPPASEESDWIHYRINKIFHYRHTPDVPYPPYKPRKKTVPQNKEIAKNEPPLYNIGDRAEDCTLDNLEGNKTRLLGTNSDYILIDFWASWCTPCRYSFPKLIGLQQGNRSKITIYAVSIDKNLKAWTKAVEQLDPEHALVHVRAPQGSAEEKRLKKLYGIPYVPRNILLDKQRKIAGIDLFGEKLEQKLEELEKEAL